MNIHAPRLLRCHSISVATCRRRHLHAHTLIRQGGCTTHTPADDSKAVVEVIAAISRWKLENPLHWISVGQQATFMRCNSSVTGLLVSC